MAKKKQQNKKKKEVVIEESSISMFRVIWVTLGVVLVFTLITAFATGKIQLGADGKAVEHEVEIQTTEILAGQTFDQEQNDYLVVFYDYKEKEADLYNTFLSTYSLKTNALPFYKVNMGSDFNKIYVAEENVLDVMEAADLKIKAPVMVEVKDHSIVATWIGRDSIKEYFTNFGK